jgi:predicted metal-dependent peptidase
MDTIDNKLSQAKFLLMDTRGLEFFSNLLSQTKMVIDPSCNTAWTDSVQMGFSPSFIERCTGEELMGTMLHEVYHDILDHIPICIEMSLDDDAHNEATDHWINLELLSKGFKLPHFINYYADTKYRGWSSMQIYYDVLAKHQNGGGGGGGKKPSEGGGFGPDIRQPDTGNAQTRDEKARIIRSKAEDKLIRAVIQTRMDGAAGSIPADVQRAYDALTAPKLAWNTILQNYMSDYARDDWTYRRPNRRALAHGLYLPDMFSQHIGELHIGIDVSLSMDEEELGLIVGECDYIRQILQPRKMHVMSFDTEVHECGYVPPTEAFPDIELIGGGGTNVQPCLNLIKEKSPEVALIFTDGGFPKPDASELSTDIFWILTERPRFKLPGVMIDLR